MPDVAIIFGGPSPEHDVSVLTGLQAARALVGGSTGSVRALYWSKSGEWYEVDPRLEAAAFVRGVPTGATRLHFIADPGQGFVPESGRFGRPKPLALDAAVVCCHGGPGEDGTLQGALDLAGIRYTGPGAGGAALGMDKLAFAGAAAAAGLSVLPRVALRAETTAVEFAGPYIVKPRWGGSSLGIEVVAELDAAHALLRTSRHLKGGAVLEPYLPDCHDLQIAARSWPALTLSAIERPLRTARTDGSSGQPEILGYADKYRGGEGMASAPRELPASLPDKVADEVYRSAHVLSALLPVRGVARIDFLLDGSQLYVNEINTIPGSLARYLWIDPVVPFDALLHDMLEEARCRPTHTYHVLGADGTVLGGAASIAAKLA